MKNGTQFNKLRLIDSRGDTVTQGREVEELGVGYDGQGSDDALRSQNSFEEALENKQLFFAVSMTCAAAAIAAGSYAIYLSRRRVAETALENVQDILQTCQRRMRDLERDLQDSHVRLTN